MILYIHFRGTTFCDLFVCALTYPSNNKIQSRQSAFRHTSVLRLYNIREASIISLCCHITDVCNNFTAYKVGVKSPAKCDLRLCMSPHILHTIFLHLLLVSTFCFSTFHTEISCFILDLNLRSKHTIRKSRRRYICCDSFTHRFSTSSGKREKQRLLGTPDNTYNTIRLAHEKLLRRIDVGKTQWSSNLAMTSRTRDTLFGTPDWLFRETSTFCDPTRPYFIAIPARNSFVILSAIIRARDSPGTSRNREKHEATAGLCAAVTLMNDATIEFLEVRRNARNFTLNSHVASKKCKG